jgi:regulator of replication initiation timing
MPDPTIKNQHVPVAENGELRRQLRELLAENKQLRTENRRLRATLDSYITRARSAATFGPVEMSAGTCVGPRRRSFERREQSHQ